MTDLDRLKGVLKKNKVKFETVLVEEDEIFDYLSSHGIVATSTTLCISISNTNDLIALFFQSLPSKLINDICSEVLNSHHSQIFPHLKCLGFIRCSLNHLPDSIQRLSHVEGLEIYFSELQSLPDWLQNFKNLKSLNLTRIGHISDCLLKLNNLEELKISYIQSPLPDWLQEISYIQSPLPDWLQELSYLKKLDIRGNNLKIVPEWLKKFNHLKSLCLYSNNLESLPDWIGKFAKLNHLNIGRNPLKTIPKSLLDLSKKTKIPTNGLYIADVPDEIKTQGWEAIRQYYAAQADEILSDDKDDIPFTATELKVMIIGAGSSGKSSISKAMNHEEHDPSGASTVGIALKNIPCKFGEQDWMLRVWDFGGQEAYAATQTLFMTENTLYLVVADGCTENRPDPYLSYIDTFAPGSPVIMIINKVDENERADLNWRVYLDVHKNLHSNMVRFSCVKGYSEECVRELYKEIESVLFGEKYEPLLKAQWLPRWRTVRSDLIELLEKSQKYIDVGEYYNICKEKKLPKDDWGIVRKACDILGIIFSYKNKDSNPPIDRIMHPEWVTKGINNLCKLSMNGLYSNDDIYPHMKSQGYNNNETSSILEILQAEELAIWLSENRCFFIPSLLPNEPPPGFPEKYDKWHMDEDGKSDTCEIRYRYPFLHPVVKQKFMVKLLSSRTIDLRAYRYGAWWFANNVRVVMMEETDDLAFYLHSDDENALSGEQRFIQTLMDDLHNRESIKSTLIHVFRTTDETGKAGYSAEYSHEDLLKLKYVMNEDKLLLPSINRIISVNGVLAGYAKNLKEERKNDMSGNTYNYYGGQTIMKNSPGAVAARDMTNSTVTTSIEMSRPDKNHFAEETNKAIDLIKAIQGLEQSHRDVLIAYLNEANNATQSDDEGMKKLCKEKFTAFIAGAGNAGGKVISALSGLAKIASFFGLGPSSL